MQAIIVVRVNLSQDEARARFAAARHAHLGTTDTQGQPHLVPVTFAVHHTTVLIAVDHKPKRTTDLKRLRNIAANPRVSLLVDEYDENWTRLWWVRADGVARVLTDGLIGPLLQKYRQYRDTPPTGPVISIDVHTWRGWSWTG